jgi:NitT/TauT family transport system ATP-binding protein
MRLKMSVVELKKVNKVFYNEFGKIEVLKDISFDIEKGKIISIVGPSGSGKSTLLNIISKITDITDGEINIDGKIGYMFQKDHLFAWRNTWNNVLIGLEITKQNDDLHQEKVKKLLEKYGLIDFINNYPHELSGGMRQRIALIRTIATEPSILLLDEPFSALDYQTKITVSNDVFRIIKEEKLTTILVTHDISEAISISDEIIVLSRRPASIKKIHYINFDEKLNPIERRKTPEFTKYFEEIWSELNE